MQKATSGTFIKSLNNGDIGIIKAKNFFSLLQTLYSKRFKEGDVTASHSFFMGPGIRISEANGIIISGNASIVKFIGDSTKCWIFRYTKLTQNQLVDMNNYVQGAEETAGHYSVGGILQFAKSFVKGVRDRMPDEKGVFCSEYTSRIILSAGIKDDYITKLDPWEIDPTTQLNWFLSDEGKRKGWILAAQYDGKGGFSVS